MLEKIKDELRQGRTLLLFALLKFAGQGLGMIAPLAVARFFASERLFGSYCLAKMVVFFFAMLLIGSSQTPFVVFANQEKAKTGRINKTFSVQLVFLLLSLAIFAVTALLFGGYITRFAGIRAGDLVFVASAFAAMAAKSFICNLFMALGQRLKNAVADLVFAAATVVFIFVFYFADSINIRTVFLVYPASTIVLAAVVLPGVDFRQLLPLQFKRERLKEMFDFTKWMMLGGTAVYFINWGDNLVLRLYASMADIGTYNVAYQIFKGIVTFSFVAGRYFLPFVSQHIGDREKIRGYLYRKRPRLLAAGGACIVVVFVAVPYIFRLLYGGLYARGVLILRVLLVGAAVMFYSTFYSLLLQVTKGYRFLQVVNVVQVLLNLALDVVLVTRMGMLGAAVATVIAYLCRAVILEVHFHLRLRARLGV